ncbi:ABC transporter permease [Siccirubricoccus sp. G192]|uniref:ABC transporter permease n=1 Tax=Siccirubricoccus sp. G192 TaxID=2849651 RepID=UPI0020C38ECB|nr:ABC transporter permease [Siccirubricoccus sp. G192]
MALCILLIFAAVAGGAIAPFAPDEPDFTAILAPPFWMEGGSTMHLLGTDQLGRDMLSRLIGGARVSLLTAGAAVLVAGTIGVALGLIAGYLGGLVEAAIMRVVDAFLALPFILMALAFVSALGTGIGNIILVMILTNWARYARLVRSEVVSIKKRDFVLLARVAGVRPMAIALRHVLPNAMTSILVLAVLDIGRAIILESSLSFLGLGIQPPDVSWGLALAEGRTYMSVAWWLTVWPGVAIVLGVMSFNLVGDWLRASFDPRGVL